jgi:hypothetical protein
MRDRIDVADNSASYVSSGEQDVVGRIIAAAVRRKLMGYRLGQGRWFWRAAAMTVVVLTLGIGFCLFDGVPGATHHHQGVSPHLSQGLCCGLLVSGAALTLLALGAMSSVVVESPPAVYVTSLRGIDPPPKRLALS